MIQLALHEYGQLLRHPYLFGEMPAQEKYDVFLSMSKLLQTMGFHQRAELLLYEAMSYTTNPYEAHMQLGLLFLDKEDLEKAMALTSKGLKFPIPPTDYVESREARVELEKLHQELRKKTDEKIKS